MTSDINSWRIGANSTLHTDCRNKSQGSIDIAEIIWDDHKDRLINEQCLANIMVSFNIVEVAVNEVELFHLFENFAQLQIIVC